MSIPLFVVHNIHVYVGIPSYLRETFEAHKVGLPLLLFHMVWRLQELYSRCGVHFYRRDIYVDTSETELAGMLAEVQNSFKKVHIGSYPSTTETRYML